MSTALVHYAGNALLAQPDELFRPVEESAGFRALFEEHAAMKARVEAIAAFFESQEEHQDEAFQYFLRGNVSGRDADKRTFYGLVAREIFKAPGGIKALDAAYWQKALDLTDVYDAMPQVRRSEWSEKLQKLDVPPFDAETVACTLQDLLASRGKFFAERVDGVFRALSGDHVTNRPQGFSKRMILNYVHGGWTTSTAQCGYIHDLRCVVARFMGRDEPERHTNSRIVEIGMQRGVSGQWMEVDGGALRIRVYLKGTAHVEVHPDMAWRLNAVLASLYPRAIAAELRTPPKKAAPNVRPILRPIPFRVIDLLWEALRRHKGDGSIFELGYGWVGSDRDRPAIREARAVFELLGGVISPQESVVTFPYPAYDVLREVVTSGCLPDRVSHQYYPTPPAVADIALQMARFDAPYMTLEPSAGMGALAEFLPREGLRCIELSAVHCKVLAAKGFKVTTGDFLELAREWAPRFHRVVMNPPFCDGQAQAHLSAAADLLLPGGRISCVLPAGLRGKTLLSSAFDEVEWSEPLVNEFAGTSVAVVVLAARRRP